MGLYQTSYDNAPGLGFAGMIANEEKSNRISRTIESALGIEFGQPVFQGAGDHGVVAGGVFGGTSTAAAVAGNTGAATITAAPPVAAGAKQGRYKLTAITAGATAIFVLEDPDGVNLGEATTGTPATIGGVGPFTITDSGVDPAIGDQFNIDVDFANNDDFVGIAILNPSVPPVAAGSALVDGYPQYFTGAFMTMGQMWVVAGGTVAPRQPVFWDPATKRYVNDATKIPIPDTQFDSSATNGVLVKINRKLR